MNKTQPTSIATKPQGLLPEMLYAVSLLAAVALFFFIHPLVLRFAFSLCAVALACAVVERKNSDVAILAVTIAALLAKLVLVGRNEIITEPNDQTQYLAAAAQWWKINWASPGYPLWLWLVHLLGIPQRIAMELLLAISGSIVAFAYGRKMFGYWGYVLVYFCIVFTPYSFTLFDRALSDGFYMCLCLLLLGLSALAIYANRTFISFSSSVALGIVIGWMAITRKETPFVASFLLLWVAILFLKARHDGKGFPNKFFVVATKRVLYAVISALGFVGAMLFLHLATDHVWALSITEMPEYTKLLKNLSSIAVKHHQQHIPISKDALTQAFAQSPELRRLEPIISDPNMVFHRASEDYYGQPGEIAAGWMWMVPLLAGGVISWVPEKEEQYFRQVNRELEAAFRNGSLKRAFVIHSLIGAAPATVLSSLPAGLMKSLSIAWLPDPRAGVWKDQIDSFDTMLERRTDLVQPQSYHGVMAGWSFSQGDRVDRIQLEQTPATGSVVSTALLVTARTKRPDVVEAFRKEGKIVPEDSGFSADFAIPGSFKPQIRFVLKNGSEAVVPGDRIRAGAVTSIQTTDGKHQIVFAFDLWPDSTATKRTSNRILAQDRLITLYERQPIPMVVFFLGICSLLVGILFRTRNRRSAMLLGLTAFLLCFAFLRIGYYGLFDAIGFPVDRRYVSVAGLALNLTAVLGLLSIASIGRLKSRNHAERTG